MATVEQLVGSPWTAADLVERFGPIPLWRIRLDPPPGSATEQDVLELNERHDRLCELVDGVLVEKTVGTYESFLAGELLRRLADFVTGRKLGVALPVDGMLRLSPGLVRIPDVSFVSWERLPGRRVSREPIWGLAPDLAAEVLSRSNTPQEMRRKLDEYFHVGVRLVWYVYPESRTVEAYTAADRPTLLGEKDVLKGGDVLPGFELPLEELFAEPSEK